MKPNLHTGGCTLIPCAPHLPGMWTAYRSHDANVHMHPGHPMFRHQVKYLVRLSARDWCLTEMQLNRKPGKPVARASTRREVLERLT